MTAQGEPEQQPDKYHWIVIFNKGGKLYTYLYRTVEYMADVVDKYYAKHGKYPDFMWAIVDNEMRKVVVE